jgi:hypothetical protein
MLLLYPEYSRLLCQWYCNLCYRVSELLLLKGNSHAKLFFFLMCNSHLSSSGEGNTCKTAEEYVRGMLKDMLEAT